MARVAATTGDSGRSPGGPKPILQRGSPLWLRYSCHGTFTGGNATFTGVLWQLSGGKAAHRLQTLIFMSFQFWTFAGHLISRHGQRPPKLQQTAVNNSNRQFHVGQAELLREQSDSVSRLADFAFGAHRPQLCPPLSNSPNLPLAAQRSCAVQVRNPPILRQKRGRRVSHQNSKGCAWMEKLLSRSIRRTTQSHNNNLVEFSVPRKSPVN